MTYQVTNFYNAGADQLIGLATRRMWNISTCKDVLMKRKINFFDEHVRILNESLAH